MVRTLLDTLRQAAYAVFMVAVVLFLYGATKIGELDEHAPTTPDPASGRVIPREVKSWTAYFSEAEEYQRGRVGRGMLTGMCLAFPAWIVAFLADRALKRMDKREEGSAG